jgi:hypothetical protein
MCPFPHKGLFSLYRLLYDTDYLKDLPVHNEASFVPHNMMNQPAPRIDRKFFLMFFLTAVKNEERPSPSSSLTYHFKDEEGAIALLVRCSLGYQVCPPF